MAVSLNDIQKKTTLIISADSDFSRLLYFYLSKKNVDCFYSQNVEEALELVERKRPEIIIGDLAVHSELETLLHKVIDSTTDYDPDVYIVK